MKKIISLCVSALMLMGLAVPAFASDDFYNRYNNSNVITSQGTRENPDGAKMAVNFGEEYEKIDEGESFNAEDDTKEVPDNSGVDKLLETEKHISYISGYKEGNFVPNGKISREEAATLFYNLLKEEPEGSVSFDDVADGAWSEKAIGALAYLEIINGYKDGSFKPSSKITRAEFVTIAARFAEEATADVSFSDVKDTAWSYKNIMTACAYGWINGYNDGTFQPNGDITRAEAVKIINKMLGRVADPDVEEIGYTKRFSDVKTNHWAFKDICEAATEHDYIISGDNEIWLYDDEDISKWVETDSEDGYSKEYKYYDGKTKRFATGFTHVDGLTYYFDEETNLLETGWKEIDGKNYLLPEKDEDVYPFEIEQYLTTINRNVSNRTWEDIEYITVHYTATPNDTAYGECAYFYKDYRAASAQYFVDENSVWQCVEDKDIAWHVGNDVYYHDEARNYNTIGIEMCCRKTDTSNRPLNAYDDDWYFMPETLSNTAELVRGLMKKYAVPIENLIRHNDVTHKVCPAMFVNDYSQWQDFVKSVTKYEIAYVGDYTARAKVDTKIYSGPDKTYSEVGILHKDEMAVVYEERMTEKNRDGRWANIGENMWVNCSYLSRV